MPRPLSWWVESRDGLTIVTVSGSVDTHSAPALQDALIQCLTRTPRAVVVDLSGASVTDPEAFSDVVQRAGLWPGTPVLFCVPDPATARAIETKIDNVIPPYVTVADALSALTGHDEVVSELVLPVPGAPRRARDLVTEACLRWGLPHLTAPATLIASELVTNAVVHARTVMTLQVRLRQRYLYLGVFDDDHAEPVARTGQHPATLGGRGLQIVQMAADRWGHQPQPGGKVVWARLATDGRTGDDTDRA